MEYQINQLLQREYTAIKRRPDTKKVICQNYDHLYNKIKKNGYTDFVAHEWTVSTLSKIFGATKVRNAMHSTSIV